MSSFPSRRRRRPRRCGEVRPSADWADLPIDALLSVLQYLETIELMVGGAGRVCRSWRRAIRNEPELWRRIDMRIHKYHNYRIDEGMAKEAVRRGSGRCESFWGEDATDHFLLFLTEQAPSLKSLRLISSKHITNEGLLAALNKFPVLEELELSLCKHVFGKVYEGIGIACPRLKCLKVSYPCFYSIEDIEYNKDEEALGIATMFVLRSLQLFGSELTNAGLATILDNCPHLVYLDVRHCFNIHMDITLRAKCAGIKTMKLPHGSTDDYEFQIENPVRTRARKPRRDYKPYV
ncbi:hypothetical protein CFC21_010955 [Triticum aestivum]|uniref:F-box domain-containing protein n=6 Tax=Triticinae TaxID=1648030 RepID=A0A9R1IV68_WHEAT|nr:putative F-box/LRR-repeat protein 23 [Aegilops tauschii subsp. strangulata]XP_044448836.1 putative F-box/LRR-repeat protein 23 [Triticum aestivum]KAF6994198.1 hypothetical protein CFC21_010953 [Triticum aestivum]KAF6994200.1 hypothetical protein CFC21_010955 [Triticum aestivum]